MITVHDASYAEPPDGSIVGWGQPTRGTAIRIDGYATSDHPDERWFEADDATIEDPLCWDALVRSMYDAEPYLLVPQPLEAVALPPDGPPASTPPPG